MWPRMASLRRLLRPLLLAGFLALLLLTVLRPPPPAAPAASSALLRHDRASSAPASATAGSAVSAPSERALPRSPPTGTRVSEPLLAEEEARKEGDFYRPHARAGRPPQGKSCAGGLWAAHGAHESAVVVVSAECVRLDTGALQSARRGGEAPEAVAGQAEELEYVTFQRGWLTAEGEPCRGRMGQAHGMTGAGGLGGAGQLPDHLARVVPAVEVRLAQACAPPRRVENALPPAKLMLLVMRYEYVNLYHTMTDWFNAVDALALAAEWGVVTKDGEDSPPPPLTLDDVQVVFLDAHPAGSLDATWTTLFGRPPLYIADAAERDLRAPSAIFVAPGYKSPITAAMFADTEGERVSPALQRFARFFLDRHGFGAGDAEDTARSVAAAAVAQAERQPVIDDVAGSVTYHWITVVFRGDYRPHPRHNGLTTRKIENEAELLRALTERVARLPPPANGGPGAVWAVRGVHLEYLTLRQQLAIFRSSDVVTSIHGAALSLVLFMRPGTLVVELQPPAYMRPHFRPMARAVGVRYVAETLNDVVSNGAFRDTVANGPYVLRADTVASQIARHIG